ncbi:MAG: hypothetical protein ACOYLX_10150, partial [Burkholderiaceae bacterium]
MLQPATKLRLGEILVQQGALTAAQLDEVLAEQRATGGRLGRVLVAKGLLSERSLGLALARQLKVEFIDLRAVEASIAADRDWAE